MLGSQPLMWDSKVNVRSLKLTWDPVVNAGSLRWDLYFLVWDPQGENRILG
jgi:hypothetical protein